MGGDSTHAPRRKNEPEGQADWLQTIIDLFASEYGWSKNQVLSLYPAEIELYQVAIGKRLERDSDEELMSRIVAARVPMMKDGGSTLLKQLHMKYNGADLGKEITPDELRDGIKRVNAWFQRHPVKK